MVLLCPLIFQLPAHMGQRQSAKSQLGRLHNKRYQMLNGTQVFFMFNNLAMA